MRLLITSVLFLFFASCNKEKASEKAGLKMQDFVQEISLKARMTNPDFIVIPQNGIELAYKNLDPQEGLEPNYINAINGVGIEELFFNETAVYDDRLEMAQEIGEAHPVLVADYTTNETTYQEAIQKSQNEGFLFFPRTANNYDYAFVPDDIPNENENDILTLADAENYLYLISDNSYTTKSDFLYALQHTNYDVLLIDLFFQGSQLTENEVNSLKTKLNGGKRLVIAYMNIGSAEKYRYYWQSNWKIKKPKWLKKPYEGYADEIWVEFWDKEWQEIIYAAENSYLQRVQSSNFDGAYLDNVEAYYFLYYKD